MIEQNRAEFEKANIIQWHEAGYLGQGISVAVVESKSHTDEQTESIEQIHFLYEPLKKSDGHALSVANVIHEVAPLAEIYLSTASTNGGILDFCKANPNKIQLINCSYVGGSLPDPKSKGVSAVFVGGSGNNGDKDEDGVRYPARQEFFIAVGAYEEGKDNVAVYSNGGKELDCLGFTNIYVPNNKGRLTMFRGTSAAAPFVTGLLALWMSKEGPKSREETLEFIKQNSVDVFEKGFDYKSGFGLLRLPDLKEEEKGGEQMKIELQIGSKTAYVDGKKETLLRAPDIVNGTTLVPVRFIAEHLGCTVNYYADSQKIEIIKD